MQDGELLQEFLIESYENLDRLDQEFVALEQDPGHRETLASIFRTIHSIKGASGFLELTELEGVTHAGENLLSLLRDGELRADDEITTALLCLVDAVRAILTSLETTGSEGGEDYSELVSTLERLQGRAPAEDEPPASEPEQAKEPVGPEPEAPGEAAPATPDAGRSGGLAAASIRIQVDQLDELMNLAGELVLARNEILQHAERSRDSIATRAAGRLNLITSEVQERIMKVRMQHVGTLWSKYPRIVRDLSRQLGKSVRLEMAGKETELDKSLLEAIKDPLTHLVRNAVDHGVEGPEERTAAGKPEEACVRIEAHHASGQVCIEISDDGKGIDAERVRAKAVQRGLLTEERARQMSDAQVQALIFEPGLSTASAVTNVSGRGVGMDVVRSNIEAIGGAVEIRSEKGTGTTITIRIPLTLAIIPALVVRSRGARFAIPQVNLVELLPLGYGANRAEIESLNGSPVCRLRGKLLPLVHLRNAIDPVPRTDEDDQAERNVVVVRAAEQQFGIVVDEVIDTEEIVVKPLDSQTSDVQLFAGSTILGDGYVALILDALGVARRSGVLSTAQAIEKASRASGECVDTGIARSFLLVEEPDGRRAAFDLSLVDRLERIPAERVEHTREGLALQYRGEILPLLELPRLLGAGEREAPSPSGSLDLVVLARSGRRIGVVVGSIADIHEVADPKRRPGTCEGSLGSVVLDGRICDELDLDFLFGSAEAPCAEPEAEVEVTQAVGTRKVCTFRVGDMYLGIDVLETQEVMRCLPMTPVPLSRPGVAGLVNLRGQVVTSLDAHRVLELGGESANDGEGRHVVVRVGEETVSLLVDRVGEVVEFDESELEPVPPNVPTPLREACTSVYQLPGELLLLLDSRKLLARLGSSPSLAA